MKQAEQKILLGVKRELRENVDEDYKKRSYGFFKEKVKIIGVSAPKTRKVSARSLLLTKNLNKKDIFGLCEEMLKSGTSEEAVIAFDWAFRFKKEYSRSDFYIFEKWLKNYVSNWASCDNFCTHTFGYFVCQFPEFLPKISSWTKSKNRWLRRASAITLIYPVKRKKYLDNIFQTTDALLPDQDNLVQKGYGWTLKEASNIYPEKVFKYVMRNKKDMPRTALRYAIEKMPKEWKIKAMKR